MFDIRQLISHPISPRVIGEIYSTPFSKGDFPSRYISPDGNALFQLLQRMKSLRIEKNISQQRKNLQN